MVEEHLGLTPRMRAARGAGQWAGSWLRLGQLPIVTGEPAPAPPPPPKSAARSSGGQDADQPAARVMCFRGSLTLPWGSLAPWGPPISPPDVTFPLPPGSTSPIWRPDVELGPRESAWVSECGDHQVGQGGLVGPRDSSA